MKKRLLQFGLILLTALALLLTAGYWTITRPGFFKAHILPRLSREAGMDITAETVIFSPFRSLEMGQVRIGPADSPLFACKTASCNYNLITLLRGDHRLQHVLIKDATLNYPNQSDKSQDIHTAFNLTNLNIDIPELTFDKTITINLQTNLAIRNNGQLDINEGQLEGYIQIRLNTACQPQNISARLIATNLKGIVNNQSSEKTIPLTAKHTGLTINVPQLDTAAIQALFRTDTASTSAPTPTEPPAILLGNTSATIQFDTLDTTLGQIQLTASNGTILLNNNTLTLKNSQAYLNDGSIQLSGTANLAVPGYDYNLKTSIRALPLTPFIQTFRPDRQEITGGMLQTAELQASGIGVTKPNLEKNLNATLKASLTDLQLADIPALSSLADTLQLQELKNPRFDLGTLNLAVSQGLITLSECSLADTQRKVNLTGNATFDQDIDLKVNLYVAGNLQEKLIAKGWGNFLVMQQDGFAALPLTIPIRGTINQPVIDFNPTRFLKKSVVQTGKNLLESVVDAASSGQKVDENTLKKLLKQPQQLDKPPLEHDNTTPDEPANAPQDDHNRRKERRKARQEAIKSLILEQLFK